MYAGFSVEMCLKAAIMKKERFNCWPDRDIAPELWTHDLTILFRRLGITASSFDHKNPIAPALKMVLDWRRDVGYSTKPVPRKMARDMCQAALGEDGVIEWIASLYRLDI
jgi:hypothetical protein